MHNKNTSFGHLQFLKVKEIGELLIALPGRASTKEGAYVYAEHHSYLITCVWQGHKIVIILAYIMIGNVEHN